MRLVNGLLGALILWGCGSTHEVPRCEEGENLACFCSDGREGTQFCGVLGTFGACSCGRVPGCEPGLLFACSCSDGTRGAQECGPDRTFGPCECEPVEPAPACVPGTAAMCSCATGELGNQVCDSTGAFQACTCERPPERCVPGRSVSCACGSGGIGAQSCGDSGVFGPCTCGVAPDGGLERDAGMTIDSGPRSDAGTLTECSEARPPIVPTLPAPPLGRVASGTTRLVSFFAAELGIVVVSETDARLLSRTGTELARWTAPRQIVSAAFDGVQLAVADRAAVTWLTVAADDLTVDGNAFTAEECVQSVTVSCGRFVCGPANDWDRVFYTYEAASRTEIARSAPETYNGIPMTRVPGRDAFVTVTESLSPSDFHYHRVASDGTAMFTSESPYHGDFAVENIFAFVGSPATHLVTHEGRLLDLRACHGATDHYAPDCFLQSGTLGTLRSGHLYLAMDTGSDGFLYVVSGPSSPFRSDPACAPGAGCRVERIDVDTRTVTGSAPLALAESQRVRIRHDAWSGRILLAADTGCSSSYPYACAGWSLSWADWR